MFWKLSTFDWKTKCWTEFVLKSNNLYVNYHQNKVQPFFILILPSVASNFPLFASPPTHCFENLNPRWLFLFTRFQALWSLPWARLHLCFFSSTVYENIPLRKTDTFLHSTSVYSKNRLEKIKPERTSGDWSISAPTTSSSVLHFACFTKFSEGKLDACQARTEGL